MKLASFPADFTPIVDDNFFRFEEVDTTTSTELQFFDQSGRLLGARRYAGRSEIEASPKAFLRRLLHPSPVAKGDLRVVQPEGRTEGLSVGSESEGVVSPTVLFAANTLPLQPSALMGPVEQWREIAPGEYDELSLLLLKGDTLRVECYRAEGEEVELPKVFVCESSGPWVLTFSAEELMEIVGIDTPGEEAIVRLRIGERIIGLIHYLTRPASGCDRRVAWIDGYGAVSYYTFRTPSTERFEVQRSVCDTLQGATTLGVSSWKQLSLSTAPLSRGEMESLQGLVASPCVWLLEGESWVPVVVLDAQCRCGSPSATEPLALSLSLRPAKQYWW
jgi:hypothetical protein